MKLLLQKIKVFNTIPLSMQSPLAGIQIYTFNYVMWRVCLPRLDLNVLIFADLSGEMTLLTPSPLTKLTPVFTVTRSGLGSLHLAPCT